MPNPDGVITFKTELDNKDLESQVQEAKREVEALSKSFSEATKNAEAAAKKRDSLYAKYENESKKYAELNSKMLGMEESRAPIIAELDEIKLKINDAKAAVAEYKQQWIQGVTGADVQERAALETLDGLKQKQAELLANIEKTDPALLKITSDLETQRASMEEAERNWSNAKHAARNLNAEANELSSNLENAKAKAGELEAKSFNTAKNTEKMNNGVKKAAKSAKGVASRLKSVVRSALVFTVITQALSKFRDWIGNVIKASPEATAAIAKLKGALLTLVQPLVNIIIPAFTKFVNIIAAIISKIASVFAVLTGSTVESSRAAAKALNQQTSALNGTGAAAKEAKKQLLGFDEVNQLTEDTSGGGGGGSGTIAPDFSAQEFDSTFLDTILEKVGKIAADVWAIIEDVRDFVTDFLSGEWGDAIDDLVSFCGNVRNLIVDLLEFVDYIVGMGIDSIIEKFGLAETPIGDMLESIKGMFHDASEFIIALLNGDLDGMKESLDSFFEHYKNFGLSLLDFANQGINSLLDWIDNATNGRFKTVIATIRQFINGLVDSEKQIFGGLIDFISGTFTGNWEKAWNGIKNIFAGIWNAIISILEGAINLIMDGVRAVVNRSIELLNYIPGVNIAAKGIDWGRVSLGAIKAPRLAQGAVIPPNREFLAVLGDQKNGTNVEAPLETIKQALAEVLSQNGSGEEITIKFTGDLATLARVLTPEITRQQRRTQRALGG